MLASKETPAASKPGVRRKTKAVDRSPRHSSTASLGSRRPYPIQLPAYLLVATPGLGLDV